MSDETVEYTHTQQYRLIPEMTDHGMFVNLPPVPFGHLMVVTDCQWLNDGSGAVLVTVYTKVDQMPQFVSIGVADDILSDATYKVTWRGIPDE